jgi:hypothetical protein
MLLSHMAATAAASVLLLALASPVITPQVQAASPEVVVNPIYPAGVEWIDLLNRDPELLDLAQCESGLNLMARNDKDALITGFASKGLFQFQPSTFLKGVKKYGAMPGATDKQILAAINDPYLQIYVTKNMIKDGQGGQWTCFRDLGLAKKYTQWKTPPTSADVLKKLD